MNDAAWWARVVEARTERDHLRPTRAWVLRKEGREAAIDAKAVPGIGATIVLKVDGELRKTRLFRSHEQAELVGAIADTRTAFEGRGGSGGGRAGAHPRGSGWASGDHLIFGDRRNVRSAARGRPVPH